MNIMNNSKAKYLKLSLFFTLFLIIFLIFFIYINKIQKDKDAVKANEPLVVNLLTSVHPSLLWIFKPVEPLSAAAGLPLTDAATQLGVSRSTLKRWRKRVAAVG